MTRANERTLSVGLSTCPNDTFLFHAWMAGEVELESDGVAVEFTLADVEELNRGFLDGRFDVCKVSTHAALVRADELFALPVGWALGFGVGPVVLAARSAPSESQNPRVLCPGEWTTAHLLWRLFHPEPARVEQRVFSEIIPALESGAAELGVCIHEGRFTWEARGLRHVEDLGETWEAATGAALPLGGLVARRTLDTDLAGDVERTLRRSLDWGHAHRADCLPTMRRYAQESSDEVLFAHVDLYVNAWTRELGDTGRAAFDALSSLARGRGLLPPGAALSIAPA